MTTTKAQKRERRHVRSRAKMSGTAAKPRLVVFRSLSFTYGQMVDDENGKTLISASDMKIKKGKKSERAMEVGKQIAEQAKKMGVETCVFDRNGYRYHGRVKALAEGAREGGLQF